MKAMKLAAGNGTRVRTLIYGLHTLMIPIPGKPVMAYPVESQANTKVVPVVCATLCCDGNAVMGLA